MTPLVLQVLLNINVACGIRMLSILLLIAFRPNVSARLSAHLVRLTSTCNHTCATSMCFILPIPLPMKDVFCRFCIDDQHWLHYKTQVAHHALDPFRFLCTASGDDLLFPHVRFHKVSSHECGPSHLTTSAFLCLQPSLSLRRPSLLNSCSRIRTLGSIASSTERVASIWRSCVVKDLFFGTARRRMLCLLCVN